MNREALVWATLYTKLHTATVGSTVGTAWWRVHLTRDRVHRILLTAVLNALQEAP